MGNTLNALGKPVFTPTPTQTTADMQAAADWAEKVGGLLKVTSAQRALLTSGQTAVGWLIVETDTGRIYQVTASAPQGEVIGGARIPGVLYGVPTSTTWTYSLFRSGTTVTLDAIVTKNDGGFFGPAVQGILPEGFRPTREVMEIGASRDNGEVWVPLGVYITPAGEIRLNQNSAPNIKVIGFRREWEVA